jgi:hypothetical protein
LNFKEADEMENVNGWKAYRQEVQTMGGRTQTSIKHACIPGSRSARKRKALKGIMVMAMLAVSALVAMFYVAGAFPQPVAAQGAMINGAAPGVPDQGMNLGTMADYLFVLALPFAVGLLINQCLILKQISSRVRK